MRLSTFVSLFVAVGTASGLGATASAAADDPPPFSTLRPDDLDAPARTSVEEARRAREGAGHHMMSGSYTHVDAGREPEEKP